MKKIYSLFAVIAMLTVALGFASCSSNDDDNQEKTIYYEMGFSNYTSSDAGATTIIKEMADVKAAYQKALGVSETVFTMKGTSSSCDKDVLAKCKAAEATLSDYNFKCKFTFTVTNVDDNKVVYTLTK